MLRPWELWIAIDLNDSKAVYLQIADAIIEAIRQGKLRAGDVLPGSRKLAEQIGVNRNTLVKALDVLLAEGWLNTAERKGVFVADLNTGLPFAKEKLPVTESSVNRSSFSNSLIYFDDGLPDSRLAPITELARAYRQIFSRKGKWQMMGYGDSQGEPEFRDAIVTMLNHKRGLSIAPNELCITRGSQMALYLVAQTIIEKGDAVMIENPGYQPAWAVFANAGSELLPVGMEADGMNLDDVKKHLASGKRIKAIYTTPHHHFPTTVSLSLVKRLELIRLSNEYGFYIVEDDYDHEFHFSSRPLLPVGSLQQIENYLYIGTLSKIVAPSLRIGYVAGSCKVIDRIVSLRRLIDMQGDTIMELAVLELIKDGSIKKHLSKATAHYHKKRDWFAELLQRELAHKTDFRIPDGGLAFWVTPHKPTDIHELGAKLLERGVKILTPDKYSFGKAIGGMRLGYASLTEKQLEEGIVVLSEIL